MRRILVATVVVAVTMWCGATSGGAAADLTLVLVDQDFGVAPDARWSVTFALEGPVDQLTPTTTTTTAPASTVPGDVAETAAAPVAPAAATNTVRVALHRAIRDRVELAATLDGDPPDVVDTVTAPLPALAATADGAPTLTVDVATASTSDRADSLLLRRPGLYPVTVAVVVDGAVVAEHLTFLERLAADDDTGAPMQVAMLAAIPDPGPVPTPDERRRGQEALAAIATTAAAVDGPLSVALPPVLLDGLDDDDPDLAQQLRASLQDDEVLALPQDVLDPSSAVEIDAGDVFARELVQGVEVSNTALPDAPARRSSWLVDDAVSTDAAVMLRNLGFGMLVMSRDTYDGLEGSIGGYLDPTLTFETDLGDAGPLPAMVRAPAGALLDTGRREDLDIGPTEAAVQIMAELVTTRRELGAGKRRSVVLATPSLAAPDPAVAAALTGFVEQVPPFVLAPLSAVPSATDAMELDDGPHGVSLPPTAGPDLQDRATRIDLTRVSAQSSGSMLPDDAQQQAWMAELDTLLSTGISDEAANVALERISAEAQAVRDAVEAPRPFTFTLTGRESELRLNVRNNADVPLQVVVQPRSPKLTFPEGDQLVELNAAGVTEIIVPVEARANGTSSIEVQLVTPALAVGVEGPVVLTARVNALTGLGQVITGGAVIVLLSWWFSHFRRRRRTRLALVNGNGNGNGHVLAELSPDAAEAVATDGPGHVSAAGDH